MVIGLVIIGGGSWWQPAYLAFLSGDLGGLKLISMACRTGGGPVVPGSGAQLIVVVVPGVFSGDRLSTSKWRLSCS